jgi:hypothetical protein
MKKSSKQNLSTTNERDALLKLVASKGVMALFCSAYEAKVSNNNFSISESKADLIREDLRANISA